MADNLKDILGNLTTEVDQETLLLYLQGKLSAEKKHELEKQLIDNEFAGEALEGLSEINDKRKIESMVEMLNLDLKKKIAAKKKRRDKLKLPDQSWLYASILILILLVVICYLIIEKLIASGK